MIVMLDILLDTLDEICIFLHCIIVQNLGTERGDPSPSSICSLSTQLVMCKASLTYPEPCHCSLLPEPCHCNLLPPDGTLGWLPCLPRWFHSLWLPSLRISPIRVTKQLEEKLRNWYCQPLALVLYSHAIVVYWWLYQLSHGQADW